MPQDACLAHNGSVCLGIPLSTYLPTPPHGWDPGSHSFPVWLHSLAKFPLQGCGARSQPGNLWAQLRLRIYNPNPQPQQYRPLCTWKGSKDQCPKQGTAVAEPRSEILVSLIQKRVTESQIKAAWAKRDSSLINSCRVQECRVRVTELCPSLHFLTQLGCTSFLS